MNKTIYKYMAKRYVDAFFRTGSLKIGTLHEYRDAGKLGPSIGDDMEGKKITTFHTPTGASINLSEDTPQARFLRGLPGFEGAVFGNITVELDAGVEFRHLEDANNMFIFCATEQHSVNLMNEFGGAGFEIVHPQGFFKAISHVIRYTAEFEVHAPIRYRSRESDWT